MKLDDPVTNINFIGEKYQKRLKKLDIETVKDLLHHYPARYKDYSQTQKIANLLAGEQATICAEILEIKNIFTRNRKKLTKALVRDESGTLLLVWFNQHYLTNTLKEGNCFYFSGKLKQFSGQPAFLSPEYESANEQDSKTARQQERKQADKSTSRHSEFNSESDGRGRQTLNQVQGDAPIHTARLVPIYPETQGVSSKWLRSRINAALKYFTNQELYDPLPKKVREDFKLPKLKDALHMIHFPQDQEEAETARKRFSFEEMFFFQIQVLKRQMEWEDQQSAISIQRSAKGKRKAGSGPPSGGAVSRLISSLPFELTDTQKRCTKEILTDLKKEKPMNRLLQGDVGSGKTIVAVIASYVTALNGYQTAYMAPTEILAQQVYRAFAKYLEPFDISLSLQTGSNQLTASSNQPSAKPGKEKWNSATVPVTLEQGAKTRSDRVSAQRAGRERSADIIIGTHALLHRTKIFDKLVLVIIDEQHRFGVKQRAKLLQRSGEGRRSSEALAKEERKLSSRHSGLDPESNGNDRQILNQVQDDGQSLTLENSPLSTTTPHTLTMTATPIPRSMALTIYGHLDISTIDEMPPGIRPTNTWLVPERKREAGYRWIAEKLNEPFSKEPPHSSNPGLKTNPGLSPAAAKKNKQREAESGKRITDPANQAFVICPLIEESEHETLEDVKAVTTEFKRLQKIFSEFELGLLHGRMKNEEKENTLQKFRRGEIQILVSTPVVEVGIDIPQANIMVIEGAHRFGLASLHQLRGRVGRAGQDSYCLLFTPKKNKRIRERLKALENYNSGLKLAELDLKIRGPGELYGTKQHGVPDFKLASLSDIDLIKATRAAAGDIITELENYPELKEHLKDKNIAPN